jgi:hypothetical protein
VLSLLDIFYRPGTVFRSLRKRPEWAAPFLAAIFLTFLTTFLVVKMAGMELITLQQFQRNAGLSDRRGEASVDDAVNSSNSRVPKLLFLSRAAGGMTAALLVAGLLFMIAGRVMDADPQPRYGQMLGMVSYAFLPFLFLQMISTGMILAIDSDHNSLDLDNLTGLNLGRVVDRATANPSMFELAANFDLIILAQVVFLAFGFSKTADLPFGRCLAVCGALWAIFVLWKAALAAFL